MLRTKIWMEAIFAQDSHMTCGKQWRGHWGSMSQLVVNDQWHPLYESIQYVPGHRHSRSSRRAPPFSHPSQDGLLTARLVEVGGHRVLPMEDRYGDLELGRGAGEKEHWNEFYGWNQGSSWDLRSRNQEGIKEDKQKYS